MFQDFLDITDDKKKIFQLGQILDDSTLQIIQETDSLDESIHNKMNSFLTEDEYFNFTNQYKKTTKNRKNKEIESKSKFSLNSLVEKFNNVSIDYNEIDDAVNNLKKKKKKQAKTLIKKMKDECEKEISSDIKDMNKALDENKKLLNAFTISNDSVIEKTARDYINQYNTTETDIIDVHDIIDFDEMDTEIENIDLSEKKKTDKLCQKLRSQYYFVNKLKKISKRKNKKIGKQGNNKKKIKEELIKLYEKYIKNSSTPIDSSIISDVEKIINSSD